MINMYNIVSFTYGGGEWDRLDPILNSPLWWNASVYILCILLLVIFCVYLAAKSPGKQEVISSK
jgi:Na+-driven multidrug efflux pump